MSRSHRILCATDSSKSSDEALRYAIEMAKQLNATLTIVHVSVLQDQHALGGEGEHIGKLVTLGQPAWQSEVDGAGVTCEHLSSDGNPAEEIVRIARELSVDEVVIGTHGRRGFHRTEMGTTAAEVVRGLTCAVTVVNNEDIQD